jgi:hypothetical protein
MRYTRSEFTYNRIIGHLQEEVGVGGQGDLDSVTPHVDTVRVVRFSLYLWVRPQ